MDVKTVLTREQELLRRVEQLTEDCRQAKFDHARESHFNREVQLREVQLHDELKKYRSVMVGVVPQMAHIYGPTTLTAIRNVMLLS